MKILKALFWIPAILFMAITYTVCHLILFKAVEDEL